MFQIFTDLCVHRDVVQALKEAGFDVETARNHDFDKAPDEEIFHYAQKHARLLLSFDHDFGNVVRFDPKRSHGIVLVYIQRMNKEEIPRKVVEFFQERREKNLKGKLFIVEPDQVRSWPR